MTCSYCGTRNVDGERRCRRCGRKPDDTLTDALAAVSTDGALATAVHPAAVHPAAQIGPTKPPANPSYAIQASLFQDKPSSKVIPFEAYASHGHVAEPEPPRVRYRAADHKPALRKARPAGESQGKLDFLPPQPVKPRASSTTGEALLYCDAPVATPLHRAVATALDWAMVLISYGLFLLVFRACGGQFFLNKSNLMVFGGTLLLLGFTYGLVWVIAGSETAGMRWMRLRLTTFDGFRPEPKHRLLRFLGSCLGVCTVLGLLWSLADEESLGMQDHISHTFPTPCVVDQVFRRG